MNDEEAAEFIYDMQIVCGQWPGMSLEKIKKLQKCHPASADDYVLNTLGKAVKRLTAILKNLQRTETIDLDARRRAV